MRLNNASFRILAEATCYEQVGLLGVCYSSAWLNQLLPLFVVVCTGGDDYTNPVQFLTPLFVPYLRSRSQSFFPRCEI